MAKVGPSANFYVRVRPYWDDPGSEPDEFALHEGIIAVTLQFLVRVTFVPDVSAIAPPWTDAALPPVDQPLRTVGEARLADALSSRYVVTPHPILAGTTERFTWSLGGTSTEPRTVFYVSPEDFDRFAGELEELWQVAGHLHSTVKVDDIRDRYELVRFIEHRILDSPILVPSHAAMLEGSW